MKAPRLPSWVLLLPILVAAGISFAPALRATFVWDDHLTIVENPHIRSFSHLWHNLSVGFWDIPKLRKDYKSLYFRPLVTLSYMVDHAVYGMRPWGFHLTSVLLHLAVVILAWFVARRLLPTPGPAAVATAVFALHPSRAEAVTWISGRCDVMMALFFLLALLAFARALAADRRSWLLVGGWLAYVAALLSKESAVALAVVVPALDWLVHKPARETWRRNLRHVHLPLLVLTGAWIVYKAVFVYVQAFADAPAPWPPPTVWLTTVLESCFAYLRLVLNPFEPNLMVDAFHYTRPAVWWRVAGGALALAGMLCVAGWLIWRRRPVGWPLVLFLASLFPVLNIVPIPIPGMVAERYLYLPLLGVALLVGVGIGLAVLSSWQRVVLTMFCVLLVASWAVVVHLRSRDFGDELRLWRVTLASSPDNPMAQQSIARELATRGRWIEAEQFYARAVVGWHRVGNAKKKLDSILTLLDVRVVRTPPRDRATLVAIERFAGQLLQLAKKPERAASAALRLDDRQLQFVVADATAAAALRGRLGAIHALLGLVNSQLGREEVAIRHYRRSLMLVPGHPVTHARLALAYARAQRIDEAEREIRRALALQPDSPSSRARADSFVRVRRKLELLEGARTQPEPRRAVTGHRLRAEIYALLRAPERARLELERWIALAPTDPTPRLALVDNRLQAGDLEGARRALEGARPLGPPARIEELERRLKSARHPETEAR